ncbi:hypothetical protein TcWFU_009585 [Taenia crassiceps]|uniref:Uncharacterized protein n=1 Tax=Taenia crassiceps TaxID=6207 RepID=A0ABR4Q035_9CEST
MRNRVSSSSSTSTSTSTSSSAFLTHPCCPLRLCTPLTAPHNRGGSGGAGGTGLGGAGVGGVGGGGGGGGGTRCCASPVWHYLYPRRRRTCDVGVGGLDPSCLPPIRFMTAFIVVDFVMQTPVSYRFTCVH